MAEGRGGKDEVLTDNRISPCYVSVLTCGTQNNYYKFYKDKKGKLDNNLCIEAFLYLLDILQIEKTYRKILQYLKNYVLQDSVERKVR